MFGYSTRLYSTLAIEIYDLLSCSDYGYWLTVLNNSPRYSRTSIIPTPVCHFNVKGVQINEFGRISELSGKMHYLAN